jgi:hypothetical protein
MRGLCRRAGVNWRNRFFALFSTVVKGYGAYLWIIDMSTAIFLYPLPSFVEKLELSCFFDSGLEMTFTDGLKR